VVPSIVLFVTHDAHSNLWQLSLADPDSCPAFDRWLRESGIVVDFQRIVRSGSGLPAVQNSALDLSAFEESLLFGRSGRGSTQMYLHRTDPVLAVVKSYSDSLLIGRCQIGNLLNLLFVTSVESAEQS
jgi:hypothetical protein